MKKLISILLVAMLIISMIPATVSAAEEKTYVKVTTAPSDWSGDYLIVYEDNSYVFDGSLATLDATSNYQTVTIADNKITCDSAYQFTIAKSDSGYTIKSSSGKYIGRTSNSNGLNAGDTELLNTITLNADGTVSIKGSAGPALQFNSTSGQTRFRYFKSTQKAICLYRLDTGVEVEPACEHPEEKLSLETAQQDATCTQVGYTAVYTCECGEVLGGEEIDMIDHNYVDGKCTMCQQAEPQGYDRIDITQPGTYKNVVIVGTRNGSTYALPSTDATTKGSVTVQAVEVNNDVLEIGELTNVQWDVINDGGTLTFHPAGTTDKYLYCLADNNGVRVGSSSDHTDCDTFVIDQDYLKNVSRGRYLGIYNNQDWRCYTSHTTANIANQTFAFYAPAQAAEEPKDFVSDDEIGYDSVEEALAAGSTTLKSTSGAEMPFDVTVADGTRYIGLADGEYYTYHALELKLTAISLRGSEAGVYYQAKVVCDETLAAAVTSYGIMLSTEAMPTTLVEGQYTEITGSVTSGKAFNSGSVFNIFKDGLEDSVNQTRGEISIYANTYLMINGKLVVANKEVKWSLRNVLETVNEKMATLNLSSEQEAALADFYKTWAVDNKVIDTWGLTNIAALYNG